MGNLQEMLQLSVGPFLAAAPVELVRVRKLLSLQASATSLAGVKVSAVGLLTTNFLHMGALLCSTGVVCIFVLSWLRFRRREAVSSMEFNEQEVVNGLTDTNFVGRSERGDLLYRVALQDSNGSGRSRSVIVKKMEVDADLENRWQSELNKLGVIRHDSIIKLLHSIRRDDMIILLLYEDTGNGSLDEWLPHHHQRPPESEASGRERRRRHPPLGWRTRRAIATGVARGLFHLHHECNKPIVHRNIKPSNILLDGNLKPKIAGFDLSWINFAGLSQPLRNCQLPADSFGYTAPEYATMPGELTEKVDVYSFGVLLLILVTGRPANGPGVDDHLATWAHRNELLAAGEFERAVDKDIPDWAWHLKDMAVVFRLGMDCTVTDPQERPSMHTVLNRLRGRSGRLWGLGQCLSLS